MISLVILATVLFIIMAIVSTKTEDLVYTIYAGIVSVCLGMCIIFVVGAFAPADIVEQKEYPIYSAGNNLYFVDDKDEMHEITSRYRCISDSNIHSPVVRITDYDMRYVLKMQQTCLVLPEMKN